MANAFPGILFRAAVPKLNVTDTALIIGDFNVDVAKHDKKG